MFVLTLICRQQRHQRRGNVGGENGGNEVRYGFYIVGPVGRTDWSNSVGVAACVLQVTRLGVRKVKMLA